MVINMAKESLINLINQDLAKALELKELILIDLNNTKSLTKTAKNFGYTDCRRITKFLKKLNVDISNYERTIITEEQEKEIINFYLANNSIKDIAVKFHIGEQRTKTILKKNNIKLRTAKESHSIVAKKTKIKLKDNLTLTQVEEYYKNHSLLETAIFMGYKSGSSIKKFLIENGIQVRTEEENRELTQKRIEKTCLQKYGTKSALGNKKIRTKAEQTNLERYGTKNVFASEIIKEKIKQNTKAKYKVEYNSQREDVKEKIKQTNLERYGVEYPTQNKEILLEYQQVQLQKYATEEELNDPNISCLFQTEFFKKKSEHTCLERYGVINGGGSEEALEKIKKTTKEKYGVDYYTQTNEYLEKAYITKKENHTFGSSSPEELYYNKLVEIYNGNDIIRQYREERYPFACDFYIKSIDTFIELNLTWTHGYHKFDENNFKDIEKLNKWKEKAKTSTYYQNAIKIWTQRDIKKFECAEKNKLNYLAFYTFEDAINFLRR